MKTNFVRLWRVFRKLSESDAKLLISKEIIEFVPQMANWAVTDAIEQAKGFMNCDSEDIPQRSEQAADIMLQVLTEIPSALWQQHLQKELGKDLDGILLDILIRYSFSSPTKTREYWAKLLQPFNCPSACSAIDVPWDHPGLVIAMSGQTYNEPDNVMMARVKMLVQTGKEREAINLIDTVVQPMRRVVLLCCAKRWVDAVTVFQSLQPDNKQQLIIQLSNIAVECKCIHWALLLLLISDCKPARYRLRELLISDLVQDNDNKHTDATLPNLRHLIMYQHSRRCADVTSAIKLFSEMDSLLPIELITPLALHVVIRLIPKRRKWMNFLKSNRGKFALSIQLSILEYDVNGLSDQDMILFVKLASAYSCNLRNVAHIPETGIKLARAASSLGLYDLAMYKFVKACRESVSSYPWWEFSDTNLPDILVHFQQRTHILKSFLSQLCKYKHYLALRKILDAISANRSSHAMLKEMTLYVCKRCSRNSGPKHMMAWLVRNSKDDQRSAVQELCFSCLPRVIAYLNWDPVTWQQCLYPDVVCNVQRYNEY